MNENRFDSVWNALEDTPEAAESMKLRAQLMVAVQTYVRGLEVTQEVAAKRLGVTQPRLNDLLRGKIEKFSLDALVDMLGRAGKQISVQIRDAA